MVGLASLAVQSAKKLIQKGNLENNTCLLLCLELTFTYEALELIPSRIGDLTDFFQDISSDNET